MTRVAAMIFALAAILATVNGRNAPKVNFTTSTGAAVLSNERSNSTTELPDYMKLLASQYHPKDIVEQEIRFLDEETNNERIQEEVAKAFKAEAEKSRPAARSPRPETTSAGSIRSSSGPTGRLASGLYSKPRQTASTGIGLAEKGNGIGEDRALKELLEAEDMARNEDLDEDEEDERDEEEEEEDAEDAEDEEDEDDEEDEYDEEDEVEDELDDDEEVMTQCPDYCKCAGQYAAATTATCTRLVEEQSFGPSIAHLKLESAAAIRLGAHALRARGLQQLETIAIIDTKITDLDRTAFDGISYLFAVNLTRNSLPSVHPHVFRNNTQLNLLTISGNPLWHGQYSKSGKSYLLDAPSVTNLDLSNNGIAKLARTAFSRMRNLNYISLRGNKLRELDRSLFTLLEDLVDLDLSYNMLNELPLDSFDDRGIEILRVAGNNLTSIGTIKASKLTSLDVSNNKIRYITKEDLLGMPSLDQLYARSNGLTRIHQHAFATCEQLTHLDLRDNKLTTITEHHFRNNPRLQELLISDNPQLEALPVFKTSGLEHDTYSVQRFECANCGLSYLEEGTFDAMPALSMLNFARNRLTGLPAGLLDNLSHLSVLDLSDNIIGTLSSDMLRGAVSLARLSLAGNPLVTLQVTPFLMAPALSTLDVSRCALERVWSEARKPLKSLRFLSVRGNLLRRITVEELKATPKLSALDLTHNPLDCDEDFSEALQWLTDHGLTPKVVQRFARNYGGELDEYSEAAADGVSQWTDLAKVVCANVDDGPATRPAPHLPKDKLSGFETTDDPDALPRVDLGDDQGLLTLQLDHGLRQSADLEEAWSSQDREYEDFSPKNTAEVYRSWYNVAFWPVVTVSLLVLLTLLVALRVVSARRRDGGPVIRPPMILRQGLIDNKNCGLVYKPLQEEIATPHMPKRGSFYSSSTFHYDKIVPESV